MSLQRLSIANILCPTDFSACAGEALARAAAIARWFHARVTLLHVTPYAPLVDLPAPLLGEKGQRDRRSLTTLHSDVDAYLGQLASPHLAAGTLVDQRVMVGEPWREIAAAALDTRPDLVVMGTHGREGWDRLTMGSTSEKVSRRLRCPVLAVGPATTARPGLLFRKILCPLDFTRDSRQTIDLAFAMAEENLAEVTLLHVLDGSAWTWKPERSRSPSRSAPRERAAETATRHLRELAERSWTFCRTDSRVRSGTPWREITTVAREIGADLIVMGAHGDRGFGSAFLGSTADQVMRHAVCPVLLARPFGYRPAPTARLAHARPESIAPRPDPSELARSVSDDLRRDRAAAGGGRPLVRRAEQDGVHEQ